jgi:hypothetical protein
MATTYSVRRGETLTLYLEAVNGDPATVTSAVAKLKSSPVGGGDPAIPLQMTLQATSPGAGILPGWYVVIPDTLTATLKSSNYLVDAAVQMAGGTFISETITVQVINSASRG